MRPDQSTPSTAHNASPDTTNEANTQRWHIALLLVAVFFAFLFFGYRFGSDMAHKHNYQDCVTEGRSDCQRYSNR